MASLVPIPWQPNLYLTPSTLRYLQLASQRVGANLMLSTSDAAWRSTARQQYLWDLNGHNPAKANNPATGQRSHMRGAAFDLARTDAAAQAACRAVGLIRDANEQWHWNDPNWANMPIIPTNTGTAGGGATPISADAETDNDMIHYLAVSNSADGMVGNGQRFVQGADGVLRCLSDGEWAVIAFNFPNVAPAQWTGDAISSLISRVGLYEYVVDGSVPGGVGRVTGRLVYTPAQREYPPVKAVDANRTPLVSGGGTATVDVDGLVAALVAKLPKATLTKQDVIDAIKSVTYKAN